ncbi:type VI secretion system ImpA family N-terminal domain-containing protein [Photobacterium leiognathi]|uniref:type VI secretion system ImpA family N-terminal domain-containing protein n=2 Tax=Photobacterium leiognathi TaxID=553611 RepID=UPI0029816AA2|nr:type VI secretion system ImpA family N-terminal domain-containing protein [Photobacterium leiognathi]
MTIAVAYKSHQFRFVTDESELRNSDKYQLIRDEINRLNSPSYGKIDWEKIKRLCEELACTDGLSFLTTIYYTAALVKINGTSGLADGLELQFAVLKLLFEKNKDSLIKCAELYRWMIARIGDDLRRLDPNKSQIKDLYRCERCCRDIYEIFLDAQPQNVPDLEAISYVVFEHMDHLEGNVKITEVVEQTFCDVKDCIPSKLSVRKNNRIQLFGLFFSGLLLGLSTFIIKELLINTDSPSLFKSLTTKKVDANILTIEQIAQLQNQYSKTMFKKNKSEIINLYEEQIDSELMKSSSESMTKVRSLLSTLKYLYPNSIQLEQREQYIDNIQDRFVTQYRRFKTARTNIANLQQIMHKNSSKKAVLLANELNNYAIGLSPIYGRISYIEEQIKVQNEAEAEKELHLLDVELKGIELKLSQLMSQNKSNF